MYKKRVGVKTSVKELLEYWEVKLNKKLYWEAPECFACRSYEFWRTEDLQEDKYELENKLQGLRERRKWTDNKYKEEYNRGYYKIITNIWSFNKCHLRAYSKGGEDKPSNIVLLCGGCHEAMDILFMGEKEDRKEQIKWINERQEKLKLHRLEQLELYEAAGKYTIGQVNDFIYSEVVIDDDYIREIEKGLKEGSWEDFVFSTLVSRNNGDNHMRGYGLWIIKNKYPANTFEENHIRLAKWYDDVFNGNESYIKIKSHRITNSEIRYKTL